MSLRKNETTEDLFRRVKLPGGSDMTQEQPTECCRRSFAASLKDSAARFLADPTVAPRKTAAERLEICRNCDRFISDSQKCDICQCFMPLKTAAANMECPIGKWGIWKRETDADSTTDFSGPAT